MFKGYKTSNLTDDDLRQCQKKLRERLKDLDATKQFYVDFILDFRESFPSCNYLVTKPIVEMVAVITCAALATTEEDRPSFEEQLKSLDLPHLVKITSIIRTYLEICNDVYEGGTP